MSIVKKVRIHIIVFVGLGILVCGFGAYKYATAPITYKSELLAVSRSLSNEQVLAAFKNLKRAFEERNGLYLTIALNLTEEELAKIQWIDVNIIVESLSEDMLKSRSYMSFFAIEAVVTDQSVLPALEKGIASYINETPYIKTGVESYKKSLTEGIDVSENMAKEVDTLSYIFKRLLSSKGVNQITLENPGTMSEIAVKAFELRRAKSKLETELAVSDDFQIVQSFIPSFKKFSPNFLKYTILSLSVFGALFVLIVVSIELTKAILKRSVI